MYCQCGTEFCYSCGTKIKASQAPCDCFTDPRPGAQPGPVDFEEQMIGYFPPLRPIHGLPRVLAQHAQVDMPSPAHVAAIDEAWRQAASAPVLARPYRQASSNATRSSNVPKHVVSEPVEPISRRTRARPYEPGVPDAHSDAIDMMVSLNELVRPSIREWAGLRRRSDRY
jgi:hypothetical protein